MAFPKFDKEAGPSPGCNSKGDKNQKGGHIVKIQYWMYAATGEPNVKWRWLRFQMGGPGTTASPLATALQGNVCLTSEGKALLEVFCH